MTTRKKAPGKYYRKALSLPTLFRIFPDDATAETWIAGERWPNGPVCPKGGCDNVQHPTAHPKMAYRCRDRGCKRFFSVKTGTVMESSKLGYQVWAVAMYLMTTNIKGTSSMKLHRDLTLTQRTAWFLAHRIRLAWTRDMEPFARPVEADETYMGGKEANKHAHKKLRLGRGAVGKTAVAGVRDRETGQVSAAVVPATTQETLENFLSARTEPEAMVYTDEHGAYRGLPYHETVNHGIGQWIDGQAHTNGIESFWSLLKRAYHGTYHRMSPKHLHRYVDEFSGRHNDRDLDTVNQIGNMEGKRLRYEDLVA